MYFGDNYLLHSHQDAYRSGKSTQNILLITVDSTVHLLDKSEAVCAALLDSHKAFDYLDDHVLAQRLYDMNISPAISLSQYSST